MDKLLNFFDKYDSYGWEIIPILPKSKIPFMKGWTLGYDKVRIRKYLELNPDSNIGLRLGNVIDVEADTKEANRLLDGLIPKDYAHPRYCSHKSVHHLFQTPSDSLTKMVVHGIEFRGHRHQSLLPPSQTVPGVEYTWIDDSLPIPPLPDPLLKLYNKYAKIAAKDGNWVVPVCCKCNRKSRPIHRSRYNKELIAFKTINKRWSCHKCREDIRTICSKIKSPRLSKGSSRRKNERFA